MVGAGERVLGYTGACGLVQAMAVGYFIWDLIVSTLHIGDFGIGLFLHAVSALAVYMFGFVSLLFPFDLSRSPVDILEIFACGSTSPVYVISDAFVETICGFLQSRFHPLRAIDSFPEHALVLRQSQHDR